MDKELGNRTFIVPGGRRVIHSLLLLLMLLLGAAVSFAGSETNRMALVIKHGDGEVVTRCVEFSESEITGYEALKRSGLDLKFEIEPGVGAAVCRIDNEGCNFPEDSCFCQCEDLNSNCTYWSYHKLGSNGWQFSPFGASSGKVRDGDVNGWVWGTGSTSSAPSPPDVKFDQICQPPATETPVPTNTPPPTATPEPTDTPSPKPTPVIHSFSASQSQIMAGEPVTLSWNLDGATAAYLEVNGLEEAVVAPGNKTVTLNQTTRYRLIARNGDQSQAVAELVVTVDNTAASTPTPTATAAGQLAQPVSAVGAAAPPPSPSPTPTAMAAGPEPLISFGAASLTLPRGACTTLTWNVDHATTVVFDGQAAPASGDREVCPAASRTYVLRVESAAGEQERSLSLQVTEPVAVASEGEPEPTPELSELPTVALEPAAATPAAVAAREVPAAADNPTTGEAVRRFTVTGDETGVDGAPSRLLVAGGITLVVVLFVVVPVAMLAVGGVVWWLRRQA